MRVSHSSGQTSGPRRIIAQKPAVSNKHVGETRLTRLLCSSDGVVLLENPRGDNRLDLDSLKRVSSSIFGTIAAQLRLFNGATGESCFLLLTRTSPQPSNVTDLQT